MMRRETAVPISRMLLPSPAVCADLYRRTTDSNANNSHCSRKEIDIDICLLTDSVAKGR